MLLLTLLSVCCAISACGRSRDKTAKAASLDSTRGDKSRPATLTSAREEGANSLDIQGVGANRPAYGTSWNVYDRLLTYGEKKLPDGQLSYDYETLQPELAERWEEDKEKGFLTFTLRKDATFHDGSPVTANDVKWSFDRAVSIGGFPTFQMKAGSLESPDQFEVVDAHTFRIKQRRADKLTLPDIAVPVAAIYNSKLARQHVTDKDPWAAAWLQNNDAGGGAFKVEKFEPGVQTILARFDAWKSGPPPKLSKIVERVIPSGATRRALLERGDLDVSFDLSPRDFADLTKNPKVKVVGKPIENSMWFVDMNVTKPPFDKLEVRQAIQFAIPYDEIYSSTAYGRGSRLYGAASATPSSIEWPQPYPYKTDLTVAKALLKKAGLEKGFETKLYYNLGLSTWSEPIAILVQRNLSQIGIQVVLEKVPAATWRAEMGKKSMPFLINDMSGWLNYPEYFFYWNYHSQNAVFNTMSYGNPEMDKLIDVARFTTDESEYKTSVKGFIKKAIDDSPRVPLYVSNLDIAMRPEVVGYRYWFHRQIDYRQLGKE